MRIRNTPINSRWNGNPFISILKEIREERTKFNYTDLQHYKSAPLTGYNYRRISNGTYSGLSFQESYPFDSALVYLDLGLQWSDRSRVTIPWDKLPTSSEFNLLVSLFELKETVAMFTLKTVTDILKNPSGIYGFLNFGFMPFIQDCVAFHDSVLSLVEILNSQEVPFRTSYTVPLAHSGKIVGPLRYNVIGDYTCRFAGKVRPEINLSSSLDLIGFHPDLLTVWETIPLSFLVDYFLPIGDFLDKFVRGGWTYQVQFSGFVSEQGSILFNSCEKEYVIVNDYQLSFYTRKYLEGAIPVRQYSKPLAIKVPSIQSLFNTLYIALTSVASKRH
jgi:hypothetical protein